MLMDCLQNQVRNKDDIAWKFVNRLEDNKWLCHYCSKEFFGDLTGVKGHLLEVPNEGISICTEVPDHIRELMRSLLDEVAKEESREANRQLSTMPSLVRNSHGSNILEQPASVSPQHQSVPHQSTNHRNVQPNPTMLLGNPDTTQQPDPSNHRLDAREPPALLDQPTHLETGSEQQNPRRLSSFPNGLFLGNSTPYWLQELNGDGITSDLPIFSPELLYLHCPQSQTPIASQHMSDSHNFEATITDSEVPGAAMDPIGPSSSQDIQRGFANQEHPDCHAIFCTLAQERIPENVGAFPISTSHLPNVEGATHLKTGSERQNSSGLSSLPNEQYPSPAVQLADGITSDLPTTPGCSIFHSLPDSRDANVNTCEEIQMNGLHNPTMGSSLQNDSSLDVDGTNRLPDCSQAGVAEVVPVLSNLSLTNTVQHPDQLHPRYDKEYGNDARSFASQTPMDIDPSRASQHTTDSRIIKATIVDSQVPEASTNTTGPSSSQGDWLYALAEQLAHLALRCCEMNRRDRPDLVSDVWRVLEPMRASCGGFSSFRMNSEGRCQPPPYFICPILQEVMQDPQVAAHGFTYEAEALRGWLESGHNTSPMTNLQLAHRNLVPNRALRSAIQEWLQNH